MNVGLRKHVTAGVGC